MRTNPTDSSLKAPQQLTLGTSTFGREISEKSAFELLDYAYENGIRSLDTAEMYGGGNAFAIRQQRFHTSDVREVSLEMSSSEKIIGRWLEKNQCRDQVFLMTKVSSGNNPDNIRKKIADSLENLRTSHVEIYQVHRPDPRTQIEETLQALTQLIDDGQVKTIGCSNFSVTQIREAISVSDQTGYARFRFAQLPYNLVQQEDVSAAGEYCGRHHIHLLAYSPLGAGFLTGKYQADGSIPKSSRFDISPTHQNIYFTAENFQIVARLESLSRETGIPMTKLAMAWSLSNPRITSTLIGARNIDHIQTALDAIQLRKDEELIQKMNRWF